MAVFDFVTDLLHDLLGGTHSTDLADLGADPSEFTSGPPVGLASAANAPGIFPEMGGSSVMAQVNQAVAAATENYRDGMAIAAQAPHFASAGEQAQSFINGVMAASPEQLAHMSGQLSGLGAGEEIRASVDESMQGLLDRNAAHELIVGGDQVLIQGQSVAAAAERAVDQAGGVL